MARDIETVYKEESNYWLVKIRGELDISRSVAFRKTLNDCYNSDCMDSSLLKDIVLDFDELSYIDSTGIGIILGKYQSMKESNHKISIINAKANVLKLLTILKLDRILMINRDLK